MSNFRNIIQSEAKEIDRLHQQIHVTYEARKKDVGAWKKACAAFHSHVSAIDPLIDRVYEASELNDELVEFSVTFLELNPMFFRSGYIKEEMLRKLKRSALSEQQNERLRAVLIDAVNNRGTREFRRYCRLLPKVSSPRLIATLETTNKLGEGARRHRAAVMLGYVDGSST
jgi:hypothetical protein